MGLETLPKWGESSPTRMGGTWNPWVSSPIHLETQPNNGYENLIPKGIKFHSFSSNQTVNFPTIPNLVSTNHLFTLALRQSDILKHESRSPLRCMGLAQSKYTPQWSIARIWITNLVKLDVWEEIHKLYNPKNICSNTIAHLHYPIAYFSKWMDTPRNAN